MILNSEYQLPVLRSVLQVSVQPDGVIGEHRAGKYSTASECDLSPRHAAVVTRSEELETPPKSPAISTGLHRPGVSPAIEADSPQTEESLFPPETSMEAFLNFNFLSPEQECTLHQPDIGVNTTTKQHLNFRLALARSLRDRQFASYGRPRGQPNKASSSTGVA